MWIGEWGQEVVIYGFGVKSCYVRLVCCKSFMVMYVYDDDKIMNEKWTFELCKICLLVLLTFFMTFNDVMM